MYHFATVFPRIREIRFPFTRDQIILLMVAINEIILGLDIFLAHSISGTIVPYEWIPIIFGPVAGLILLGVGAIALRKRTLATILATVVFALSILTGLLGSYFHLLRAALPSAPVGQWLTIDLVIWAPPLFGPISFAGIGLLGMFAVWMEDPEDSGALRLPGNLKLQLPISKTNFYFLLIGLGILATVVSSVMDHARTGFANPWLWLPTAVGVFAVVVSAAMGSSNEITKSDIITYITAMALMILVGLVGSYLHLDHDLTADFQFVQERFLAGAPMLAPLNFANMGFLGLLVLLEPKEKIDEK